jgi:hypothetical protein
MKRFLSLTILILTGYTGFTQEQEKIVTHYVFPEFSKGTILMKNGVKKETLLNYNSLTEEMLFDNNGTKLALANPESVDTVFVNGRRFFMLNDKFVELVYKSKYMLCAEHKCKVEEPGTPSGYGGTSKTSATTVYSSIMASGHAYDLKLPEGFETEPYVVYWLIKDGAKEKFLNVRQLTKMFDDKESKIKEYLKKNDVKFNDQQSMINYVKFLEKN